MVVDLKVLDRIVDDDDPEHSKISFGNFSRVGESIFSRKIWLKMFFLLLLLLLLLLLILHTLLHSCCCCYYYYFYCYYYY